MAASGGGEAPRILVVEDRESLRRLLLRALGQEGYEVRGAATAASGVEALESASWDLVLTDLKLPDGSGLEVLRSSRELSSPPPVVVMTAYGSVSVAVEAMKLGALDFLEKPVEMEDLFALVAAVVDRPGSCRLEVPGAAAIVARHPRMRAALHLLEKVAPTDSTVLLTGESGTGKELFARALHALSPRSGEPFLAVNCAAIPESLMENELFGHEKGAFTGAERRQPGRFELAGRGTLLLDEIGELGPAVQGKVLRVLEERTFERVGGGAPLRCEARLVAATNRDLEAMVESGAFRSDLFYRLDVFPIALPPLRERPSDIPLLADYLVERIARRLGVPRPELTDAARAFLQRQEWRGNVRELANLLERAVILAEGPRLGVPDLRRLLSSPAGNEKEAVRQALLDTDGDKRRAAELLGVSYATLQRRVKRYGLEGFPRYRD